MATEMLQFLKRKKTTTEGSAQVPSASPPPAFLKDLSQQRAWFERYGHHYVEKNKYFTLLVIMSGIALSEGVAINLMLPLKEVIPYVLVVNKTTGEVEANRASAQRYSPGDPEKMYFLGEYGRKLMEIDKSKSEDNMYYLADRSIDNCAQELSDFRRTTNLFGRLAEDETLTRVPELNTVTPLKDSTALVRINTVERSKTSTIPTNKSWLITIHYKVIPPVDEKEMLKNPLGLYCTHFGLQEETAK